MKNNRIASISTMTALLSTLPIVRADTIQFGWDISGAPLDGATRIINWQGYYTNLTTGASGSRLSQGNFDGLTAAENPHLDDPDTILTLTGSQCWAYHNQTNGTFEAAQKYLGVNEGASTKIDANESMAFSFNNDVSLKSIGWQGWSNAVVEISYQDTTVTNTSGALFSFGSTNLASGSNLLIHVLSGATRVSGITVEYTPPTNQPPATPVSPFNGTNVLFIAIDDLKRKLGCYGDDKVKSPRIDSFAATSTLFLNAHCQYAVCGPTRASLITGLMPEEIGVLGFKKMRGLSESGTEDAEAIRPNVVTLPQYFRYHGWRTAATGKVNDPRCVGSITNLVQAKVQDDGRDVDDPPSWGEPVDPDNLPTNFFTASAYVRYGSGWSPEGNPTTGTTNLADSAFVDGIICDEGLNLLRNLAAGDTQFFLAVGFKKPHLPFVAPQKYWDLYDRSDFTIAPFQGHPTGAVPYTWDYASELKEYDDIVDPTNVPVAKQLEMIHGYYACVSFIDTQIGRLLDELEAQGLAGNTIVVIWGDHGFHLGDHAEWGKHTNLEQATQVPLIIHDPFHGTPGARIATPVNFVDLYPTLCEFCGLPIPEQPLNEHESPTTPAAGRQLKGKSLLPVITDPNRSLRTGALSLFRRSGKIGYAYRTDRYRLIEWIDSSYEVVARELYDYQEDPLETVNLAVLPQWQSKVAELGTAMRKESEAAGCLRLPFSSPRRDPGTIFVIK